MRHLTADRPLADETVSQRLVLIIIVIIVQIVQIFLDDIQLDRIQTYYLKIHAALITRNDLAFVGFDIDVDIRAALRARSDWHLPDPPTKLM
jgi:hypothetical protein